MKTSTDPRWQQLFASASSLTDTEVEHFEQLRELEEERLQREFDELAEEMGRYGQECNTLEVKAKVESERRELIAQNTAILTAPQ